MVSLRYEIVRTAWGDVAIVAGPEGACRLILPGYSAPDLRRQIEWEFPESRPGRIGMDNLAGRIKRYFEGRGASLRCPLDLSRGTAFQRRVWRACAKIPLGRRSTYGELAAAIGCRGGARAVGQALGRNPVPLIVPCHRIVSAGGGLGGFSARGGVALKKRLLGLESRISGLDNFQPNP